MTDEQELKLQFAEAWLRNPSNAFLAAKLIAGEDPHMAMQMANAWVRDPEVAEMKKQLIAEYGEESFLPSKASMIHDILDRARNCPHNDDYVKLMRLMSDMRGWIEKPGLTVNNNVTTNKVMVVPIRVGTDGATIDSHEWEKQLIEQQTSLISNG